MPFKNASPLPIFQILIVDDEVHCIETLRSMLARKFGDQVLNIQSSDNVAEARELIMQREPDLVFLDVEMPHQTGFDLLKSLDKINFDVIFTTAYENYAINAIKFNALDYLLKPFGMDELEKAIEKFRDKRMSFNTTSHSKMEIFLSNLKLQTDQKKISLPTPEEIIFAPLHQIIRCKSSGDYSIVYFSDGTNQLVLRSLKEFEFMLEEMNFLRINYDHVINLQHVSSFAKGQNRVTMSDGSQIQLSDKRRDKFIEKLGEI